MKLLRCRIQKQQAVTHRIVLAPVRGHLHLPRAAKEGTKEPPNSPQRRGQTRRDAAGVALRSRRLNSTTGTIKSHCAPMSRKANLFVSAGEIAPWRSYPLRLDPRSRREGEDDCRSAHSGGRHPDQRFARGALPTPCAVSSRAAGRRGAYPCGGRRCRSR
jgi:hypothetical protein